MSGFGDLGHDAKDRKGDKRGKGNENIFYFTMGLK